MPILDQNNRESFTIKRITQEHGIKAILSFSGGLHAPVHMADIMEKVNAGRKQRRKWHVCCAVLQYISYAKFSQILGVLWDFHRLFGSKNSPTTVIYIPCSQERVTRQRS